ncbi:carbamoyltransferase HypF [Parvibacter caecicola]|uniref:carbamoyltransferase HypF n=1 Tax=Parvibacter caecicola TaxID=747645 RepID=UPI00249BDC0A|nr:carbamoyltransferase HypF [Parvibacter caecicola]
MIEALNIHVKGIVQGVGFRPFVYRAAKKHLVNGWVLNAVDGVHIHAEAESNLLDAFVIALSEEAPAAAAVKEIDLAEVPVEGFDAFEIRFSDEESAAATTLVSPDLATCDDCRRELFDPGNRRFRYPFINCTNCGPRFTIIEQLPYDRGNTSMGQFHMDAPCAHEYADPADRRFHAQPDACFTCGPHLNMAWKKDGEAASALEPLLQLAQDDEEAIGTAVGGGSATTAQSAARALNRWQQENDPLVRAGRTAQSGEAETAGLHLVWGNSRATSDAILAYAVDLLTQGRILAVKGLGGYHLICDGNNPRALATLRQRKRRDGKAFAVMMESAEEARRLCQVSEIEQEQLMDPAHPIVLLRKKPDASFAEGLADHLSELGAMLPYTPVQLLLMHDFAAAARAGAGCTKTCSATAENPPLLVMTSGNLHDEPICISDGEARRGLTDVADAFIGNDRPILTRFDDSVLRVLQLGEAGEAVQMIRRARGFAPRPLALAGAVTAPAPEPPLPEEQPADAGDGLVQPECAADATAPGAAPAAAAVASNALTTAENAASPVVFATGPEQKNTFAFLRGNEAFVSQHIGDMENAETYDSWLAAKNRFSHLFRLQPQLVACDAHPEYLTSKWAHDQALPVVEVQHHHAHVASAMAEAGLAEAVCGIAFDGTGYGADGAIWGGEALLANLSDFERFANFAYVPMPGGAAAVKHPLRMAYGVLWAFDLLEHPAAARVLDALGEQARICDQMIEAGFNTPMTSSVGRLFDAASAILGVCPQPSYEGQGAIELEAVMELAGEDLPDAAARDYAHGESGREDDLLAKERYAITVEKNAATATSTAQDTSVLLLDAAGTFKALLDDLEAGVPVPVISRRFHDAFAGAVLTTAGLVQALYGISKVVLTGGVFMNRYLVEQCTAQLREAGLTVVLNRELPPNDGCISLGQAIIATHRAQKS